MGIGDREDTDVEAGDAHDVRQGGRWTRLQTLKNGVLFVVARLLLGALGPLPRPWLMALGGSLGALGHAVLSTPRRLAVANVGRALSHLSARERDVLVRRTFRTLGAHLGDTVDLYGKTTLSLAFSFEEGSLEALEEARSAGRGVVFASAHLGPWERVAASMVRAGVPLVTLAREAYDPRLTRVLVALRERHGVRAIFRGSEGAASRIVRTLRAGGVLGAPMDLASRVPNVGVPFLGFVAPTPIGPARLALRTGAQVVVGTYVPTGFVRVRRVRTDDLQRGPDGELELLRRINAELSARILAAPEHWPWMHDRFRVDPKAVPLPFRPTASES